jgi:ABC-type histidine transport system ATPase subunit
MAAVLEPQQPSTSVGAPIVRITALRKSYGTNEVLKGIDLDVKRGEVIAIIGKSGSGKSTLLRCINGLEVFQEGALTVDGKPLLHESAMAMRELRQRVGMIFQSFNLFPHLTVGKNVMLAPTLVKKRGGLEAASQARKLLTAWACRKSSMPCPTSSPAASSSAWPLPARWPWSRPCCCATRSRRRSTPSWWARCCAWWSRWPTRA